MERISGRTTPALRTQVADSSRHRSVPPISRNGRTDLLNRAALARETGVSKSHIAAVFAGNRTLTFDLACRIADALGWNLEELCDYLGFERGKRQ